jgi:hypothetical protein
MEFYHQRRGILARYDVEAPLRAVLLGRSALLVEYPPNPDERPAELVQAGPAHRGSRPQRVNRLPDR